MGAISWPEETRGDRKGKLILEVREWKELGGDKWKWKGMGYGIGEAMTVVVGNECPCL
jgi:hypothetical protein